ncbi:MAG: MerR family transcriptional regulator [bacterium]|nr:MerR family transcriptional regulator [bacterium]
MKVNRKKGFFSISAVAKMFSVHQQTIRLYEKQGLITPERSAGNTRLFSEENIDRLEEIIYLTHKLGINLAGVDMIFKLKKQIKKMQKDMNALFETTQQQLDEQALDSQQAIQVSSNRLMQLKQQPQPITASQETPNVEAEKPRDKTIDTKWEIEYDPDSGD